MTIQGRTSKMTIDNLFCKFDYTTNKTNSGILLNNLSDHQPYFILLNIKGTKACHVTNTKHINVYIPTKTAVHNILSDIDASDLLNKLDHHPTGNPNLTYQKIHDIVEQAKNKHMSGKLVKCNKYKHKNIAWLTNGLLRSIKFWDKLYKHLKANLRTYNRILRKSLRAAKRIFYSLTFDKYKADIKNIWKTINGLLSRNCQTKLGPTSLTINGLEITNKLEIVNTFNNFFTNIGANLAKRINYTGDKTFRDSRRENK